MRRVERSGAPAQRRDQQAEQAERVEGQAAGAAERADEDDDAGEAVAIRRSRPPQRSPKKIRPRTATQTGSSAMRIAAMPAGTVFTERDHAHPAEQERGAHDRRVAPFAPVRAARSIGHRHAGVVPIRRAASAPS
jgi:hypothetical protein